MDPTPEERAREQVRLLWRDSELVVPTLEAQLAKTPPTADTREEATFL